MIIVPRTTRVYNQLQHMRDLAPVSASTSPASTHLPMPANISFVSINGSSGLVCLASLLALASPVLGLNFNDSGGWRAPLSLDTTSVKRGDPTKVAWGIVPDGTRIAYPGTTYNNLNASMKARFGADYADMFTFIYNRIGAVSGLELIASPDDGALAGEATPPTANVRGEIRLVGSDLVAWDNWWGGGWANGPGQGVAAIIHLNMGLNTRPAPPSYSDWLDITMHETGHAIGFAHQRIYVNSTTSTEYTSSSQHYGSITGFRNGDGPQFDDVYAMHRMYGDKWERGGGNDTLATAENLEDLTDKTRALGTDIVGLSIAADKTDFRSIDGTSDTDCFKFTIALRSDLRFSVAPVGPTYDFEPEGGTRRTFQSARQSALRMVLYDASGVALQTVNAAGVGVTRTLARTLGAGTYSLSIAGTEDLNQFYRLDLAAVTNNSVPTPPTISSVADQSIVASTATAPLAFTVGDLDTAPASLTVTATSSNTSLVPNANIAFGGSGTNRTVTVTPVAGLTGTAAIALAVSDGELTASSSFLLTVTVPSPYTYTIANGAVTITGYTGSGGPLSIPGTINGQPVTSIGDYAFVSCYGLTSVAVPAGITSIGTGPFADCVGLTAITVDAASADFRSVDGVLFDITQTVLIQYPGAKTGSFAIPASVTSIRDYAFYNCANLSGVMLDEGVTSIGIAAFYLCPGLAGVIIPASVTAIGEVAFGECYSLASARFMGNAPTMGLDVFLSAASGFTVQYYNNRNGFTSPLWNGYPAANLGDAAPLIALEQPAGINLANISGAVDFGSSLTGSAVPLTFTIRNTGSAALTGIAATLDGTNAAEYALTSTPASSLLAGGSSTFVVTFIPAAAGTRTAALHIASNDATNNPFTINLTGSAVDHRQFALVLSTSENGQVSGAGTYLHDTTAEITALPDPGYVFTAWSGDASGTDNPLSVLMDADKTIAATFSRITYGIEASAGPHGSIDPSGTVTVGYGDNQAFSIMPNAGYDISQVTVDGVDQGAIASHTFTNVQAVHTILAKFQLANQFASWIQGFPGVGTATGFDDDPDGDGINNGIEFYFGSSPSQSSAGLMNVVAMGSGFRFRHSARNNEASGITAVYQWSSDLVNWFDSGVADGLGVTATFADAVVPDTQTPDTHMVEVTVAVRAGAPAGVFARIQVRQNP